MRKGFVQAVLFGSALALASQSQAAVSVGYSTATPTGTISQTDNTGAAVQQDYTDNGHSSAGGYGAPGQSFLVPAATGSSNGYKLTSISVQVEINRSGNYGTFFSAGGSWGIQVATFDAANSGGYGGRTDGTGSSSAAYTAANAAWAANTAGATGTSGATGSTNGNTAAVDSLQYKTVAAGTFDTTTGNPWVTFTFSGTDAITLLPGSTYSFDVFNNAAADGTGTSSYMRLFRGNGDTYSGGAAYNSYSSRRNFNDDYVASTGGDRTFVVGLTPATTPEPASLAVLGLAGVGALARRRKA